MKEIIKEATTAWGDEYPLTALGPSVTGRFITAYYKDVPPTDIEERSPRDLAGAAVAHLDAAASLRQSDHAVRVFNPSLRGDGWESTHTVVQVVTTDRPFLVDSLTMVINEFGFANHLVIHPIIPVVRDADGGLIDIGAGPAKGDARAESFVHLEIDRETDETRLQHLALALARSLRDVALAVADWPQMLDRIGEEAWRVQSSEIPGKGVKPAEIAAFVNWLLAGNMTVLGVRDYTFSSKATRPWQIVEGGGRGILRDDERPDIDHDAALPAPRRRTRASAPDPIVMVKSEVRSTVHRAGYLDYVGVRRFDESGRLCGELRILGLYTSTAHFETPRAIPIVRQKIQGVLKKLGADPQGHDGRALFHILDTYPRAELFEADVDYLAQTALGILHLQERQRARVFIRADAFDRYFACQVYVPRDHFDTAARIKILQILEQELDGDRSEFTVSVSDAPLARLHIVVHRSSRGRRRLSPDAIEKRIAAAVQPWSVSLQSILMSVHGEEGGLDEFKCYADSFPAAYREDHDAREAVDDIPHIKAAAHDSRVRVHIVNADHGSKAFVFKLFSPDRIVEVSRILPILENMGIKVRLDHPYEIRLDDGRRLWIHDYECNVDTELGPVRPALRDSFQDAVSAAWYAQIENDRLNTLVLSARLSAQRIVILRAYAHYLRQIGTPYGLNYINNALAKHPDIAARLVDLFEARFDPDVPFDAADVETQCADIENRLDAIESLDEDRIVRTIFRMVLATLRTNYFQRGDDNERKACLSLKVLPAEIPGLPEPKPAFEVFVYSPQVEGVHLRGDKVARGGLRWSDRREDFRTEILGLMKAQTVKNAVIVPAGAKGGFVVKTLHTAPDKRAAQGLACYRTFIRGLLDLTDNLVDGQIVHPTQSRCHDGDDPYFVVAADKGTATFSDTANELSAEYGYWLGDAFASGGSDGYDHKKMGITARGAWESVRHHGAALGLDVDREDFRVVGIGDMSGDVFGNGMLLSRHIQLVAAFNHLHIFIDPNPEAEPSFLERRRLFRKAGSRWSDYDPALISAGGGVYSRSAKAITLSDQARAALDISDSSLAPDELIGAILRAPVDLLWNGGVGTYVKAAHERNEEVGDKSNDRLRVNAEDLRCRMIGEGGNLGLTHPARIAFAAAGGAMNTDWIDNSGGVDCSDHEVNIKILLNQEVGRKTISLADRNVLLKSMQSEVADAVLDNNRAQAQALSLDVLQSCQRIDWYRFTITQLERDLGLDREFEILPSDEAMHARSANGQGLFRPELASLIAWAKIDASRRLAQTEFLCEPQLDRVALEYFPSALRERYGDAVLAHPLRDEIVATLLSNLLVNRMGISFIARLTGETGVDVAAVARVFMVANESLGLDDVWRTIDAPNSKIDYASRCTIALSARTAAEHAVRWLLRRRPGVAEASSPHRFEACRDEFCAHIRHVLSKRDLTRFEARRAAFRAAGISARLAIRAGALEFLPRIFPLSEIAERLAADFLLVARCYAELDAVVPFTSLYDAIDKLPAPDMWADRARNEAGVLAATAHLELTESAVSLGGIDTWQQANTQRVSMLVGLCTELETGTTPDLAKVLVVLNQIRSCARAE